MPYRVLKLLTSALADGPSRTVTVVGWGFVCTCILWERFVLLGAAALARVDDVRSVGGRSL
jgi:ABC-type phosphate transport system permease subunit